MRILLAAIPALLFGALFGGASFADATTSASAASVTTLGTSATSLKCKPPKVPTQVTVKGKTKWKCGKPTTAPASAAPSPVAPPSPPAADAPAAPPPREPSN